MDDMTLAPASAATMPARTPSPASARRGPLPRADAAREFRVCVLLFTVALLSAADLWMTLLHMRSGGMMEANVLVRNLARLGSPALIAWWKLASVTPFLLLIFITRRRPGAELTAAAACVLLAYVTWHWAGYSDALMRYGDMLLQMPIQDHPSWITLR